jgi:hypothetical protein
VFNVHESSINNNSLRDEKRLQRSPTPQSFQPSQSKQGNEELVDHILRAVMGEFQEKPIFEEMHDTDIPFELEQHKESSPSRELLNGFQSSRTLIETHDFWVEQHMQATPRVRPLPRGSTHTCTQLHLHSQTPSPKMETSFEELCL